ncbi:uncharacterized protein BDR25DRAFT_347501 [Lindgomyces ingoldianus]|uniref:Uncharacterized protein n=1 Tax=Lindgomyces ingoldianus TaxID=673940 RepID=A0ACB6Q823_9PLEO|nr:uncharacterized protein BDR25DRAFT_347501 [Lindgomyces ingoldianus]KAF2463021.1 hypothetical protein BDR25DRAFT_347501 [Lindgomyces ingoldianus]
MEEREASITSSTDFYGSDKPDTPGREAQNDALSTKRKAEELESSQEKKRKLEPASASATTPVTPCAGLLPEIWQHIFLSCSLADLGRLLLVNRSFHSCLTDIRHVPNVKPDSGFLRLLKSESIWAAARNAHPTKPPKPLPGFSELQMWQLVWGKRCQFCTRQNEFVTGEKIWQKGPGSTGVRTIWPFGVRACGPCLLQRCRTDSSLLFSTASALRPALPFAFLTTDQNYVLAYTLQAATTPAGVDIGKYYFNVHVEDIMRELEQAQSLGSAATEEWSKGLDGRGKERMKASENWERWEVKYQWWSDHHEPKRPVSKAPSPAVNMPQTLQSPLLQAQSPIIYAPVPASAAPQYIQPRPPTIPPAVFTPQPVPGPGPSTASSRAERNLHDANEAKAARRVDIERRCQQLAPPIPPNILRHMDSFKAAIQISQPMNDYSWNMLYPRLLAQLPAAQQAESDHVSRLSSLTTRAADRRQQDASLKEVKEVLDREWEESQRPIREKLSVFADEFINQDWDHGRAVTYENSPKFAVDLLVYVRRMFYAELPKDQDTSPQPLSDPDSAEPQRLKLVLENMKWVYDNKLKPITEQFRKELFLCYGSGCEGNTRFYGFEGVIQHFGAKHTNAFSVGNVVVAWREAEWPEDTPFHPDPISVKHAHHPASSSAGHGYGSYYGGFSRAGTSTPHMAPHLPQASPGPYNQYGSHYSGPFAPPPSVVSGYDYSHSYGAPMDSYSSYQAMGPPAYAQQASNAGYLTSVAATGSVIAPAQANQPQGQDPSEPSMRGGDEDAEHRTNLYDKQVSTVIQIVQDIWKQTSGIKDLPNSVRIYVLLLAVISKFHVEFNHEPNLNHFIDALSNHEIPKALKNAPGLSCKACLDELSHQSSATYPSRPEERRTYTVLNLLSHFKSQHHGPQTPGYGSAQLPAHLDWKEDMIELPSDRLISGLIHAPGMDDQKLHLIATVFPKLFPMPLPKIGISDNIGVASPGHSLSKEAARTGGTPGTSVDKSGPSSLASPYTDSPRPPKPSEDEYDPRRPALPSQSNQTLRMANKKLSYHGEPPPADRRHRYYAEPRYYVGGSQDSSGKVFRANDFATQVPRDHLDEHYPGPREYMELPLGTRIIRDAVTPYDDYHDRRSLYREHEEFYGPEPEIVYAHPREGLRAQEYGPYIQEVRYRDEEPRRPEYRLVRDFNSEPSPSRAKAEADRFLEEFDREEPSLNKAPEQEVPPRTEPKPPSREIDPDDGSRYTPPPPNVPSADEQLDPGRALPTVHHTASSTVSNGSRYEENRPNGRQVPTPDSGVQRRIGPHGRRDRIPHEHIPSRYYRYMSVAREEPYIRGASMHRSQSRRYERYEETRRRLDQQETPHPNADRDYDPAYSRDQSVDQGPPDEHYYPPVRHAPAEYVPVQERLHPYSPTRYRFAGPPEESRGPPPVYVDEYCQPVHEYGYIRVPRDPRSARGSYLSHPPSRYVPEHDFDHIQYVPIPNDRPLPQRLDDPSNSYVYYEERERAPPPTRRPGPAFEPDNEPPYEPPDIKVETAVPIEGP